jgi:serine/threonine protein kinase, bacterial
MISLTLLDINDYHPIQKWTFTNLSTIKIGRSPDNHIVIDNPLVSRYHLELQPVGNNWHLISHGSNGTFVNDILVTQTTLAGNDRVQLAKNGPLLKFEMQAIATNNNCTHAGNSPNNLFCIHCGQPLVQKQEFVKDYQLLKVLGVGGMGTTYIAWDKDGKINGKRQVFVLKEMNADMAQIAKARELFEREANILKRLHHPGIPQYYDFFVYNGKKYLAMELMHGKDLDQVIREKGPVSPDQAITWMMQTCDVLYYIHTQNPPLVHRDIKPANLLVRNLDQSIVVLDFGAVKEIGTTPGTKIGAPAYWSPEQSKGKPVPQSDLYAIGATLIFLLTGREPDKFYQVKGGKYQYVVDNVPTITPELRDVINKVCEYREQDRYQDAKELSAALAKCLS